MGSYTDESPVSLSAVASETKRTRERSSSSLSSNFSPKELIYEAESLKTFTFFAIAISTVATLTAVVAVPVCLAFLNLNAIIYTYF